MLITFATFEAVPSAYRLVDCSACLVCMNLSALRELATRVAASIKNRGILKILVPFVEDIESRIQFGEWHAETELRHSLAPVLSCLVANLDLGVERPQVLPQFAYLAHSGTWPLDVPS